MVEINIEAPRQVAVNRYVTPLREGGSLPAIAEAEDGFLYVLKFRGAGQGPKALVAELIGGELARLAGFKMPEIVFAQLDEGFGRTEPDEEIQDLLKASVGLNLALHYLSGSITYDPVSRSTDAQTASRLVWFDAWIMNVDRTFKNTNLLYWNRELWLIDHGASLYFHHNWSNWQDYTLRPFTAIKDHVLLPLATELEAADAHMKKIFSRERITEMVNLVPDEWLASYEAGDVASVRQVYIDFLAGRLEHSSIFVKEAQHARSLLV
ncbi:MAG: aminotransferase class I and II [Bacteroidetes bacterium]|nr:aminotransferase class I and II [Bacteroidota bacterium]HOA37736.1 aminotransferase class I and II [Flavihumibacter sp.]